MYSCNATNRRPRQEEPQPGLYNETVYTHVYCTHHTLHRMQAHMHNNRLVPHVSRKALCQVVTIVTPQLALQTEAKRC